MMCSKPWLDEESEDNDQRALEVIKEKTLVWIKFINALQSLIEI